MPQELETENKSFLLSSHFLISLVRSPLGRAYQEVMGQENVGSVVHTANIKHHRAHKRGFDAESDRQILCAYLSLPISKEEKLTKYSIKL